MANYRQINFLEFPEEIGNTMLLCVIDDSKSRYELLGRYNGYYPGTQQLDFTILYFRVKSDDHSNPWVNISERHVRLPYEVENQIEPHSQSTYIKKSVIKQGAIAPQLRLNSADMESTETIPARYILYAWFDLAHAKPIPVFSPKFDYPTQTKFINPRNATSSIKSNPDAKGTHYYNPDAKDATTETYSHVKYTPTKDKSDANFKTFGRPFSLDARKQRNLDLYEIFDDNRKMDFIAKYVQFVDTYAQRTYDPEVDQQVFLRFILLYKRPSELHRARTSEYPWIDINSPFIVRINKITGELTITDTNKYFNGLDIDIIDNPLTGTEDEIRTGEYTIKQYKYLDDNEPVPIFDPNINKVVLKQIIEPSEAQAMDTVQDAKDTSQFVTTDDSMEIGGRRRKSRRRTKRSRKSKKKARRKTRRHRK